jgi:hypothetical protein
MSVVNPALEMQIKNYIQTQLRNGYTVEIIKNALISQGFNPGIIQKVVDELSNVNINVKHEVNVSKGTIIGVIAAIFIVGFVVYGVFNLNIFQQKESLLDIAISSNAYSYMAGDTINYQLHMTNMGSMQKFDATIKYLIVDDAGNIITRTEETLAVQTTASINRNIKLPSNIKSGKYNLQAIADYGNKQAKSSIELEVVSSVLDKKPITYVPPVNQSITSPNNGTSTKINAPIDTTNPTVITIEKTFGKTLTEIKDLAQSNPESANNMCAKLSTLEQKDICYSIVADSSKLSKYCDNIGDVDRKDNCYLTFVMKGSTDVCDQIVDNSSQAFCNQLRILKLMDQYYKENNTEKILELSKQFNPSIYDSNPQIQTYEYVYNETNTISVLDIMNNGEETPVNDTGTESPVDNTTNNGTEVV